MQAISLTLIGRDGCHLCDDAWSVITGATDDFLNLEISHRMVEEDPVWMSTYTDSIPVVLINNQWHSQWHVDASALREALVSAGAKLAQEGK